MPPPTRPTTRPRHGSSRTPHQASGQWVHAAAWSTTARMRAEADEAEQLRNAAAVAVQTARDDMLEALTSPEASAPPRWTSPAKIRGRELYMHTPRRWLAEFRVEPARRTAAALPAQKDAHDRTARQVLNLA